MIFNQVATTNYQGTVIAFASGTPETPAEHRSPVYTDGVHTTNLYFNVLALNPDDIDSKDWTGWQPVVFPNEVQPAGMQIITAPDQYILAAPRTTIPGEPWRAVQALGSEQYLYLFCQTVRNTLLVNRYRMVKQRDTRSGEMRHVLEPAWEVRFVASGKADTPASAKDALSYLSADRTPFLAPSVELFMCGTVQTALTFETVLLPTSSGEVACQVFALDASASTVSLYNFPISENGELLFADKEFEADGSIPPDNQFALQTEAGKPFTLSGTPGATYYQKQERVLDAASESYMVKRTGRLMLALRGKPGEPAADTLVTIDFSVSTEGTLARPQALLKAGPTGPANYAVTLTPASYISFHPVNLLASFALECWIYPRALAPTRQQIVGGAEANAPYLCLVEGSAVELGFTDANGAAVSLRSAANLVVQQAWNHIKVSFDTASAKASILINGHEVHSTLSGHIAAPNAQPIQLIGAVQNGFVGDLDDLRLYNGTGAAPALTEAWPFDSIDYSASPPTTPNSVNSPNPGKVSGAALIPSASPVAADNNGTVSYDGNLTIYTAYLHNFSQYGELHGSPYLLAGSDGLVHCYFRGKDDDFNVLQYNTEAARALFTAPWSTRTVDPQGATAETGKVQFVASQSGTLMNAATVRVIALADAALNAFFCDVELTASSGLVERFNGVPRSMRALADVLNGKSTADPGERRLLNASITYYDALGRYPAAYIPLKHNAHGGQMAFVTRLPQQLPLKSIRLADPSSTETTVTLEFTTPHWNNEVPLTQTWPKVPIGVNALLATLEGLSPDYPYQNASYSNLKSYSLAAVSVPAAANRVVLWLRPEVIAIEVFSISNAVQPDLCNVEITLLQAAGPLSACWQNVLRKQGLFARILEGVAQKYDYPNLASGDYQQIGKLLIITTNGQNANLSNHSGPLHADGDMLAGASLFSAFPTARIDAAERITEPAGPVAATPFQSARNPAPIEHGSSLFAVQPDTQPHRGAVAFVADTPKDGKAPLQRQGVRGGWLNNPPQRCLEFNPAASVVFSQDAAIAPNISALTLDGDMSLELWCRPGRTGVSSTNQRLLTFNRTPPGGHAEAAVRYLASLRASCPALQMSKDNQVRGAAVSNQGTFYTWFSATALADGVIGSISTLTVVDPVLQIKLDTSGQLKVALLANGPPAPITSKARLQANTWYALAVTYLYEPHEDGSATISAELYLDGQRQGSLTHAYRAGLPQLKLGTMVLGTPDNTTLPMLLNESALFTRHLIAEELRQFAEQRIPDNHPGLAFKWMFIDANKSDLAINSAATGALFNVKITPAARWAERGTYFLPTLGYGENIGIAKDKPILAGWNHLAMVHQAGYALQLNGETYADCGNDPSLQPGQQFALESWVQLASNRPINSQTLVAKGMSASSDYKLWIRRDFKPVFECRIGFGSTVESVSVVSPEALDPTRPHYLAVNFEVTKVLIKGEGDKKDQTFTRYEVRLNLYVNGLLKVSGVKGSNGVYRQFEQQPQLVGSNGPLELGRSPELGGSGYLTGYVSDVRLWGRTLTQAEISSVFSSHRRPAHNDGLISAWRFNDGNGKTALDSQGSNDARLSKAGLMVNFKPTAANWFYVNGELSVGTEYTDGTAAAGGYGAAQFRLGAMDGGSATGFTGLMDELRIWGTQLTQEQITDSMTRALAGNEAHLLGLWGFDNGSGTTLTDGTGRSNNGKLSGPRLPDWQMSTAPLNDEASVVRNVLGGIPTFELQSLTERPAVIDYADVQRDAYGGLVSVMKRGYFFYNGLELTLNTGFKVGDLKTVFIGQVQTDPKLVGFIEGGPPVPSENQTRPYWKGTLSEYTAYDEACEVEFESASETTWAFGIDRAHTSGNEFSMKGGLAWDGEFGVAEGFLIEATEKLARLEGKAGLQVKADSETTTRPGYEKKFGSKRTINVGMEPGGSWEPGKDPAQWLNPSVGRRYIPCNVGCAVVKSLTADLYASMMSSTGMMVKLSVVPNPDIPEDVNLINFPIDPKYVKNGCLDGNVGLKADPDIDPRSPSYFKPLQAYALKRQVERQEKQLEAYYLQFSAEHYASQLLDHDAWQDFTRTVADNPAYDWARHVSQRNIVNTYVWTAAGGTYAEETSTMNVFSESYNVTGALASGSGVLLESTLTLPFGPFVEIDYLSNLKTEVSAVRSKEQSTEFSLKATVQPEVYLGNAVIDADGGIDFPEKPTPGKVDGYRYMAFFLAPDADHFQEFKSTVVDQQWLAQSMDSAAAALRQATASDNGAWRILYRVTYVSRIPPAFQPVPTQTIAPDVQAPVNIEANALLIQLVKKALPTLPVGVLPTSLQIGTAITAVLGTPATAGKLNQVLPWWGAFLQDSLNYQLSAADLLRTLREDLLQYMTAYYASLPPQ